MTDDVVAAPEAAQEVVQTEVEQAEAPEAVESTDSAPIEATKEGEQAAPEKPAEPTRGEKRRKAIAESERQKREIEEKLAETQAELAKIKETAQKLPVPKEEDFDTFEEYQANLSAYHSMKAMDGRRASEVEEKAAGQTAQIEAQKKARDAELAQSWQEQSTEARKKYADFDDVVYSIPISDATGEILATSDIGSDIAYYLGSNREFAEQLATASPAEQGRQLGILEAKLNVPSSNKTTSAPEPINPVSGTATPTVDPAKMSPDQYREYRLNGGKL